MNIYYDEQGVVGRPEQAHLRNAMDEFRELAKAIKHQLGRQGFLLDRYLLQLLTALNSTLAHDAADEGMQILGELTCLCNRIIRGEPADEDHPLYQKVKEYIAGHPFTLQVVPIKGSLYTLALLDDFLEYALPAYAEDCKRAISKEADVIELHDLYRQIAAILGSEDQLEQLNLLIRQRFQLAGIINSFVQGINNSLIYALSERDAETNKTVLQLWLEG